MSKEWETNIAKISYKMVTYRKREEKRQTKNYLNGWNSQNVGRNGTEREKTGDR